MIRQKHHYADIQSAEQDHTTSTMDVVYFVGPEVEYTKMHGVTTLFKVGDRPLDEILEYVAMAEEQTGEKIRHIYFTANHSLPEIKNWSVLHRLLTLGYYVTVDGFAEDIRKIDGTLPYENELFIAIIGVPILQAEQKSNVYIKIDIEEFGEGNPGVWLIPLKNIIKYQDSANFTPWSEYKKDVILK